MLVFHAHPAVGLNAVPESSWPAIFPRERELGARWSALEDEAKDSLEREFFREVLRYFSDGESVAMRAELPLVDELRRLKAVLDEAEVQSEVSVRDRTVAAPMPVEVINAITDLNPVLLTIEVSDVCVFSLHDSWSGVLVRLTPNGAQQLAARLERFVRE